MCIISNKIKFCSCAVSSVNKLQHYWLLYRFNKRKMMQCLGIAMLPNDLQLNYQLNKKTLVARLNEADAFDQEILFQEKDQIEIVINNLLDDNRRIVFCFRYHKGKWIEEEYEPFGLMNNYDELLYGKFKQLKKVKNNL